MRRTHAYNLVGAYDCQVILFVPPGMIILMHHQHPQLSICFESMKGASVADRQRRPKVAAKEPHTFQVVPVVPVPYSTTSLISTTPWKTLCLNQRLELPQGPHFPTQVAFSVHLVGQHTDWREQFSETSTSTSTPVTLRAQLRDWQQYLTDAASESR